jgi:hypothetical protein
MLQEVSFFEEGEPKIDGEPGDLKVLFFAWLVQITVGTK